MGNFEVYWKNVLLVADKHHWRVFFCVCNFAVLWPFTDLLSVCLRQKQHSQSCTGPLQNLQPIQQLKNNNNPLKTSNWAIQAYPYISFSFLESDNQTTQLGDEETCCLLDFEVKTVLCTQLVVRQHLLSTVKAIVFLYDYLGKQRTASCLHGFQQHCEICNLGCRNRAQQGRATIKQAILLSWFQYVRILMTKDLKKLWMIHLRHYIYRDAPNIFWTIPISKSSGKH